MPRFVVYLSAVAIALHRSAAENCLQELSMSQLLRIKKSLQELTCDVNECRSGREQTTDSDLQAKNREIGDVPFREANGALPLTGVNLRRSHDSWDEKPTKIQSVFQLSITALSFLAFGGYLLCMIVQAIKSKGTTYFHPSMNGSASGTGGASGNVFRKVKIYSRSRRSLSRNNTKLPVDDRRMAAPSPDDFYNVMIQLAEGYVKLS